MTKILWLLGGTALALAVFAILNGPDTVFAPADGVDRAAGNVGAWGTKQRATGAGGQILGMEAFLLGYRSPTFELSFIPPFALRILGYSPFLSYLHSWSERKFDLTVSSWRHKIEVQARAPKGTFFSLSSPFPEGHRENYLGQSFAATIRVRIWVDDAPGSRLQKAL